jgi:hypothetical protein
VRCRQPCVDSRLQKFATQEILLLLLLFYFLVIMAKYTFSSKAEAVILTDMV